MQQLTIDPTFDIHDHRHGLKLLKDDRETMVLENRDDVFACPACGNAFDRLFVSEKRTQSFGNPNTPFCLVRTDTQLLVLTH